MIAGFCSWLLANITPAGLIAVTASLLSAAMIAIAAWLTIDTRREIAIAREIEDAYADFLIGGDRGV